MPKTKLLALAVVMVAQWLIACNATPAKLAFTGQPLSGYAGDSLGNVTVQLQDGSGKIDTAGTAMVTLTASSGTLQGTTTAASSKGIATFGNLHIDAAASS